MALAIITGASRGLGFENAKSLAALGHDIVLIAKDSDRLLLAQQSLQSSHPNQKFSTYAVDLEDMQATRKTVELIAQQHSSPEILILAHGVMDLCRQWLKHDMAASLFILLAWVECLAPEMQAVLRHIESVKLALTHLCETLPTKPG